MACGIRNYIKSEDVFDRICDLLEIPKEERNIISMDVHLSVGSLVTYDCKRYAEKKDRQKGGQIKSDEVYIVGER